MSWFAAVLAFACLALASPAWAGPRDTLIQAGFVTTDRAQAQAQLASAIAACDAILARAPQDREARLQRGLAIGYRAMLDRDRGDALAARATFESLVASRPDDAEAQLALGGWHVNAVIDLGAFMARTALGARAATGLAALDRASRLGADRTAFPAMAAIFRIALNKNDISTSLRYADAAIATTPSSALDRHLYRAVQRLLPALRSGDGAAASALARTLIPFARLASR